MAGFETGSWGIDVMGLRRDGLTEYRNHRPLVIGSQKVSIRPPRVPRVGVGGYDRRGQVPVVPAYWTPPMGPMALAFCGDAPYACSRVGN